MATRTSRGRAQKALVEGTADSPLPAGEPPPLERGRGRPVRERLREDAEENYELLRRALDGAVNSETTRWGTCQNCNHRVSVTFPDIRARVQAVQLWLDQGYGKPPVREDHRVLHINAQLEDLQESMRSLSDEELLRLASEDDAPPEAA